MSGSLYHVENLAGPAGGPAGQLIVRSVDGDAVRRVFRADWRQISVVAVPPGSNLGPRRLDDSEVMLYVTAGHGRAYLADDSRIDLRPPGGHPAQRRASQRRGRRRLRS